MKTEKDLRPLIDGDVLLYRCGFAADAQMVQKLCADDLDLTKDKATEMLADIDYTALALHNVGTVIDAATERFNDQYKLYVHDVGNFRYDLATIKPYKGNRKDNRKPKYSEEIKRYMVERRGAIPVRGIESDDAIGIEQFDNSDKYTVIYSIDKDMDMIPGWHYNWVKGEMYYQTITDANRFLFWQMLVGDTTDNIPGINRIGVKRATEILNQHESLDALREAVKDLYRTQYGEDWERAYTEVGRLLYILRRPSEQFDGCPLL